MRLKDKVTIITGAAHGIGKAYARRFADEGAHVVIADIDAAGGEAVANAILAAGGSAWARTTDVRSLADLQGLMQETVKKFGRIDVLLNNAAIYVTQNLWKGAVEDLQIDEWDRVIEVNLKGVFLCSKAVIPIMKQQRSGKIINIASGTFFSGSGNMPHYTTAKGGVVALTRVMARQLGPYGINVNCMTPGSTMSEENISQDVLKRREGSIDKRAFRRVETPADIVGTALFLASSDSDFITGQLLVVEGGGVMH
ncbi:MAG TPA: glucose 1-dehydrogenase [Candidatus Limnocylindrales bacterium]|nr:glucose 1-dehydrogenase [Candidatus Limnocylindrales bacterium]